MLYAVLLIGGIFVGMILGLFIGYTRIKNIGILHVDYSDEEFMSPLMFLELKEHESHLRNGELISMWVRHDTLK